MTPTHLFILQIVHFQLFLQSIMGRALELLINSEKASTSYVFEENVEILCLLF